MPESYFLKCDRISRQLSSACLP